MKALTLGLMDNPSFHALKDKRHHRICGLKNNTFIPLYTRSKSYRAILDLYETMY
ncbi:hypothetical protein [Holospora curviuscula]|uniref:hypothetical protein n=1 Tax=Holospora curviuscula TaxID=1082868 RepID=UPI0013FD46F0|nr:hypothetical protein [Holospora curviuscula]